MNDDKVFAWTDALSKKLFQLRFENDWLFKSKKQPWKEFHQFLIENGFPKEMTVDHVRKKWSYNYDMFRLAKKAKNKNWKHYKMFNKHFSKSKTLDSKYDSWNDEWRLKLIICISEAKEMNLDIITLWRTVERAMRCQDLPLDCCVQDIKGLWHHIKMTFNRKHRMKLKNSKDLNDWALYDTMLTYCKKYEPDYLADLDNGKGLACYNSLDSTRRSKTRKKTKDSEFENDDGENEFMWSKDITESFIQIRLQHDWLFKQRKWAWNKLVKIMVEEYGFPKTLTSKDVCKKWASTYAEYQKAQATNNKTWVYHHLFELYLGESKLSLNPLVDWQEEWVCNLITARTDLESFFGSTCKEQNEGWREVEKRLRSMGLPLDHSLLDLPETWAHLLKTFRWKRKFAQKGMLTEQWPYFEGMSRYEEVQGKSNIKKQKVLEAEDHFADMAHDDDYEDDLKLFDLKQKLQTQVKPKFEVVDANQCRSCANMEACVSIFEQRDDDGLDVAQKLRAIAGIEVEKSDNLPSNICLPCLQELENAYKFRRKCLDIDKHLRNTCPTIKMEVLDKLDDKQTHNEDHKDNENMIEDDIDMSYDPEPTDFPPKKKPVKQKRIFKKKKVRKYKYDYWKICEICGKHTKNLRSHLDMHATGKTYSCDVCDKKFKFKSALIIHRPIHDPTPKKTCEICGKTFHILAQYRRHFVYHANERKYECETCGKRFNTLDILRVHNRIHTDERPFSCDECGKTFRTAGCVSRHKRIVHKIRKVQ